MPENTQKLREPDRVQTTKDHVVDDAHWAKLVITDDVNSVKLFYQKKWSIQQTLLLMIIVNN